MVRRHLAHAPVPVYCVGPAEAPIHLTPHQFCELARSLESWFREHQEELIEDVCRENQALEGRDRVHVARRAERPGRWAGRN